MASLGFTLPYPFGGYPCRMVMQFQPDSFGEAERLRLSRGGGDGMPDIAVLLAQAAERQAISPAAQALLLCDGAQPKLPSLGSLLAIAFADRASPAAVAELQGSFHPAVAAWLNGKEGS